MLLEIVKHTPIWVWVLLAVLVAVGLAQTLTRRVSPIAVGGLAAGMTAYSIYGVLSSFGPGFGAIGAWAIGLAGSVLAGRALPASTGDLRYKRAGTGFELPGSWVPLGLIIGLFAAKYLVGVLRAMEPAMAREPAFVAVMCGIFGLFSGIFIARAVHVLRIMRRSA